MKVKISLSKNMQYFAPTEMEWFDLPYVLGGRCQWCAAHFKDQHRSIDGWISGQNILVFDFDIFTGDMKQYFSQFFCLVGTTKSHMVEKNGVKSPRYRAIFPVDPLDITPQEYSLLYKKMAYLMGADPSCADVARKWSPNNLENFEYWFFVGDKIKWKATLRKAIAEEAERAKEELKQSKREEKSSQDPHFAFMRSEHWPRMFKPEQIAQGNRHNSFVRILRWAKDNGCSPDDVVKIFEWINTQIPMPLPQKECSTIIKYGFNRLAKSMK